MLKRAEPPICVGLYARWGSGKTFMISLLKKEFDPTVHQDQHTKQLLQFFEEGYKKPDPEQAETKEVCSLICSLLLTILLAFSPTMSYGMKTFISIICDAFDPHEALHAAWAWCSKLMIACIPDVVRSSCSGLWSSCSETLRAVWAWCCSSLKRACARWKPCARTFPYHEVPQPMSKDTKKPIAKEYVFVDFNAWECAYLASK